MTPTEQLQALQNAINNFDLDVTLRDYWQPYCGKKAYTFILLFNSKKVSPPLTYDQMNHFIYGFATAKDLTP